MSELTNYGANCATAWWEQAAAPRMASSTPLNTPSKKSLGEDFAFLRKLRSPTSAFSCPPARCLWRNRIVA